MSTVATMTPEELREMIASQVEKKLIELFGDPDEGLPVRKVLSDRLAQQRKAVSRGERGQSFKEVTRRLGLGIAVPPGRCGERSAQEGGEVHG